jgi:hypothetical protein
MKLNPDALQVQSFAIESTRLATTTSDYSPDCCTDGMSGCDTDEAAGCSHVLGCGPALPDTDAAVR